MLAAKHLWWIMHLPKRYEWKWRKIEIMEMTRVIFCDGSLSHTDGIIIHGVRDRIKVNTHWKYISINPECWQNVAMVKTVNDKITRITRSCKSVWYLGIDDIVLKHQTYGKWRCAWIVCGLRYKNQLMWCICLLNVRSHSMVCGSA